MTPIISARGLTKKYGRTLAVDHIDLDIPPGRIVGLIGPNGAGKTSALKAILGLATFNGELSVLGKNPSRDRAALMKDVCFIADVAVLPRWIRVWQLIDVTKQLHSGFSRETCMEYLAQTKITMNQRVKQLSKGMVAQLHLALVMAIDVKLLVLDEPTLGLDILYRKQFYSNLLNDYFDEQRTIVITTHQVEEVEHILTDLIFIQDGKIVLQSTMEEVERRYVELMVKPEKAEEARSLNPLYERELFGRHIFLYDDVERERLAELGEIHTPSVADLFVATMKRGDVMNRLIALDPSRILGKQGRFPHHSAGHRRHLYRFPVDVDLHDRAFRQRNVYLQGSHPPAGPATRGISCDGGPRRHAGQFPVFHRRARFRGVLLPAGRAL